MMGTMILTLRLNVHLWERVSKTPDSSELNGTIGRCL